ncbi:hypothetical protein [Roseivirga sp.]|uniref:hypothetical protein n=1 Tax=Roseivirga sp. TaxID=1964215 RepID=UPI003B524AB8
MSRAKLIDHYLEQARQPDFEIDQIRKELDGKVPEEDIRAIVRVIDSSLQTNAFKKTNNGKASELVIAGLILTLVGAGITVGTYTGLINMGDSFLIVYGPFFGGLSLLITGMTQRKARS